MTNFHYNGNNMILLPVIPSQCLQILLRFSLKKKKKNYFKDLTLYMMPNGEYVTLFKKNKIIWRHIHN